MPEPEYITELDTAAGDLLDAAIALGRARDGGDQAKITAAEQGLMRAQSSYDEVWARDQAGDRRGAMGKMEPGRRRAIEHIHAERGQVLADAAGRGWVHAIDPDCGLDWQGPARAWDTHLSGSHALAHQKGHGGLAATSRLTVERMATPAQTAAGDREAQALDRIARVRERELAAERDGTERSR
jgi:hypothetical protein